MFRFFFSPFFSLLYFISMHFICFVSALFFHSFILPYSHASCSFWYLHNYLCTDYPFQFWPTRIPLNAIYKLNKKPNTSSAVHWTLYTLVHIVSRCQCMALLSPSVVGQPKRKIKTPSSRVHSKHKQILCFRICMGFIMNVVVWMFECSVLVTILSS